MILCLHSITMQPIIKLQHQIIRGKTCQFLTELQALLKKHDATIGFEAETIEGQGSMVTVDIDGEQFEVEVESPDSFDLDSSMMDEALKHLVVFE